MAKTSRVTKIEKSYKDKKSGKWKKIEIEYAKVADRVKEFREENPKGLIDTSFEIIGDMIAFKAKILKNKSDRFSAEATGHAVSKNDKSEKLFEKLETLSVGRALAMLGYLAGGEIASSEEMEDYNAWRDDKVEEAIDKMNKAKSINGLKKIFISLGSMMSDSRIIEAKDKRKEALNENSQSGSKK